MKLIIQEDASEDDKKSLRSSLFDIEIDLNECVLFPGSEVRQSLVVLLTRYVGKEYVPYTIYCRIGSGIL